MGAFAINLPFTKILSLPLGFLISSAHDLQDATDGLLPPPQEPSLIGVRAPGGEGLGVAAPGHPDLRLPHTGARRDHAGCGARLHRLAARRRGRSGAVAAHRHGPGSLAVLLRRTGGRARRHGSRRRGVRSLLGALRQPLAVLPGSKVHPF